MLSERRTARCSDRCKRSRKCLCRHDGVRRLEVSLGSLLWNQLVQRQTRDRLAQPRILRIKIPSAASSGQTQATILMTRAVICPRSRQSTGPHPLPASLAPSAHQPGVAWRRSLSACVFSFPFLVLLRSKAMTLSRTTGRGLATGSEGLRAP